MQVIGAGLPRTGTLTQKLALERLGFAPCYHWVDVIADLDRVQQWDRALDGEADWQEIFGDCVATVDWPGGFFYAELAAAYPEAKVDLTENGLTLHPSESPVPKTHPWAKRLRIA